MSDDVSPSDALKAKLKDFANEVQSLLAGAGLARVILTITQSAISVQSEGVRTPRQVTPPPKP